MLLPPPKKNIILGGTFIAVTVSTRAFVGHDAFYEAVYQEEAKTCHPASFGAHVLKKLNRKSIDQNAVCFLGIFIFVLTQIYNCEPS